MERVELATRWDPQGDGQQGPVDVPAFRHRQEGGPRAADSDNCLGSANDESSTGSNSA